MLVTILQFLHHISMLCSIVIMPQPKNEDQHYKEMWYKQACCVWDVRKEGDPLYLDSDLSTSLREYVQNIYKSFVLL